MLGLPVCNPWLHMIAIDYLRFNHWLIPISNVLPFIYMNIINLHMWNETDDNSYMFLMCIYIYMQTIHSTYVKWIEMCEHLLFNPRVGFQPQADALERLRDRLGRPLPRMRGKRK